MKRYLHSKKASWSGCILAVLFAHVILAEGTKQFMPVSTNFGYLQINDVGRPFALMTNTDPLQRLYFHISSTSEKVYFGFSRHTSSPAASATFRIKNPSGTIVYGTTTVPTSGSGKIGTYAQAVAGPKIGGVPAAGYSPLTLTPATTGDYYIEFSSTSSQNYRFEFFDLTVVNASNVPINGRLWSYAWDLNTAAAANPFNGFFYVYTGEGYVSKVDMNGIQAFGFVTSCNSTGPQNTGNVIIDRRSIDGNSTRPEFKIFLNDPDNAVYPTAPAPGLTSPFQIVGGTVYYGQPVQFTVGVSAPGTIQVIININGVSGYQSGTSDVLLAVNVVAGTNYLTWNGVDGFGNYPTIGTQVEISTGFSAGITHLPIYDPETHVNGFIVDRIRPGTGSAPIRWDDSNFSGGTVNISGGSGDGHAWPLDFGNLRTMNTWWNGYEVENADQFVVTVQPSSPLPVELIDFTAELNEHRNYVLSWTTASEQNAAYFTVEKTNDPDKEFEVIGKINAHGNSTVVSNYSLEDTRPINGYSYYRILIHDFNGTVTSSKILKKHLDAIAPVMKIFPNPGYGGELFLDIDDTSARLKHLEIISATGQQIYTAEFSISDITKAIKLPQLSKGIYYAKLKIDDQLIFQRLMVL
jgi:hypothetical protein